MSRRKERPFCGCGCGERVKRAFLHYLRGHAPHWSVSHPERLGKPSPHRKPRPLCACGCGTHVLRPNRKYVANHCWRVKTYRDKRAESLPHLSGAESPQWKGGHKSESGWTRFRWDGLHGYEHRLSLLHVVGNDGRGRQVVRPDPSLPYMRGNMVVCTEGYGKEIQRRVRAFRGCGHADWRWCPHCGTWDNPANMTVRKYDNQVHSNHRECAAYAHYLRKHTPKDKRPARGPTWRRLAVDYAQGREHELRLLAASKKSFGDLYPSRRRTQIRAARMYSK